MLAEVWVLHAEPALEFFGAACAAFIRAAPASAAKVIAAVRYATHQTRLLRQAVFLSSMRSYGSAVARVRFAQGRPGFGGFLKKLYGDGYWHTVLRVEKEMEALNPRLHTLARFEAYMDAPGVRAPPVAVAPCLFFGARLGSRARPFPAPQSQAKRPASPAATELAASEARSGKKARASTEDEAASTEDEALSEEEDPPGGPTPIPFEPLEETGTEEEMEDELEEMEEMEEGGADVAEALDDLDVADQDSGGEDAKHSATKPRRITRADAMTCFEGNRFARAARATVVAEAAAPPTVVRQAVCVGDLAQQYALAPSFHDCLSVSRHAVLQRSATVLQALAVGTRLLCLFPASGGGGLLFYSGQVAKPGVVRLDNAAGTEHAAAACGDARGLPFVIL